MLVSPHPALSSDHVSDSMQLISDIANLTGMSFMDAMVSPLIIQAFELVSSPGHDPPEMSWNQSQVDNHVPMSH